MKKYLFIAMVAAVSMVFAGCEKNDPCTCNHTQTPCSFHKMTVDIPVAANEWQFDTNTKQYFVHVPVEGLTQDVYDFGDVTIFHEYHHGTKSAFQVALPETTYELIYEDNGDGTQSPYQYQQHIDYALGVGFVEIIITISDYFYDDFTPEDAFFRMQLTY